MNEFATFLALLSSVVSVLLRKWYLVLLVLLAGLSIYLFAYYGNTNEWQMQGDWRTKTQSSFKSNQYMRTRGGNYFVCTDNGWVNVKNVKSMRYKQFQYSLVLDNGSIKILSDDTVIGFFKNVLEED